MPKAKKCAASFCQNKTPGGSRPAAMGAGPLSPARSTPGLRGAAPLSKVVIGSGLKFSFKRYTTPLKGRPKHDRIAGQSCASRRLTINAFPKPGKLEVACDKTLGQMAGDLARAYSPGVAEALPLKSRADPRRLPFIHPANLVGALSHRPAVLGLGKHRRGLRPSR